MLGLLALAALAAASPIEHVSSDIHARQLFSNSSGAPTVQVRNGSYYGYSIPDLSAEAFIGIPFANAPRFARPTSLNTSWTETRNATEFGPICPGYGISSTGYPISEDCLSLNVVRPAGTQANDSLPTLLWIFGGGFVQGTGRDPRYNMTYIVKRSVDLGTPVVGVTINYRVAAFGFLGGSAMQNASALNAGLYDQEIALRWWKENARSFGADPSKTTIFGQSAGGGSVVFQTFAFGGQQTDLFRSAIVHSGTYYFGRVANVSTGDATFNTLANATGCSGDNALACLRSADFQTLFTAANGTSTGPTPDGEIYPEHGPALAAGNYRKIPMIVGNVNDEGTSGTGTPTGLQNETQFEAFFGRFTALYDNSTFQRSLEAFPNDPAQGSPFGTGDGVLDSGLQDKRANWVTTDFSFVAHRRLFAQQATQRQPIWTYRFDQIPQNGTLSLGVSHFYDVPYTFGVLNRTVRSPLGNRPADLALSKDIQTRWINFVVNGDPNSGGNTSVAWPEYGSSAQQIVFQNDYTHIETDDYRQGSIGFVNSLWNRGQ